MLVPAITYKDKLDELFAKEVYTERYFYYVGYAYGFELPKIEVRDNYYQWAIVDEDEYLITKSAELNGVKFKDTIEHWAHKEKKDKYAEAFCDADSFVNQVQSAN